MKQSPSESNKIDEYLKHRRMIVQEGQGAYDSDRGKFLYPSWPYPFFANDVALYLEFFYEFLRGSRLATTNQLEICNYPVQKYLDSTQAASEYLELATLVEEPNDIIEGVFRIADTLMWWTPMFLTCELSARYIVLTLMQEVRSNLLAPWNILLNLIKNNFSVASDTMVLIANFFYNDQFSTAFWLGDLFYLLAVMQPQEYA